MPVEQFCLRWNNHHPNLITVFSTFLQNDQMVDVTLISENQEIHAHKIVLSACSPFFQNIFLRNSCKHPVIVLTGIKYDHIKSLIYFIYNGEVNIRQDHLAELLRVANTLKIKGLDEVTSIGSSVENQDIDDSILPNTATEEDTSTSQTTSIGVKQKDITVKSIASTSEQTKTTKKRKSVTFSDTPEIVWGHLDANSEECQVENSGNGKRKLSFYASTESASGDDQAMKNPSKKQRISGTSRKMIRKNENFLRALQAVRDEGMGFCKAAKIHGVNNRTLWLEYQKLGYPMKNARKKSQS
ncbi:longitudinals lacking protein, isoforms H/M/V-like isoform X2 [Sitodiplosis mosellana]|uniref:longitudinals lacking protein, isoforms H/M/V-like isoform X2 n=1 Tax=Sitodiplosis mosellana TaxID=263140 RepID=UPI0024451337|nr:longitudinals lacking protein, isoforms H/M/V-like isoform X2 [Sitodiplosis mosellana]